MNLQKITFTNKEGQTLVGRLELPADRHPHNFVLFAHCFTCNKNLSAVKNIGKALTSNGFAVLRFDFTGLGESDGDFADTNFSGNVNDLVAAATYLEQNYQAPSLLIGHSLGGAAVVFAAAEIPSIKAVATIGAPSNPVHVKHLLHSSLEEISEQGHAVVNLSGRDFTIKKQFLDDLETKSLPEVVKHLRKPILILHSPQDTTVGIINAEEIYVAARHPKSFVSQKKDSTYAGDVIAGWAKRYLFIEEEAVLKTKHQVAASLDAEDGFTTQMKVGSHYMHADEPISFGGNNFGPSPYEFVSAGLSACTAMTIQMYAKRKGWQVDNVEVHTSYSRSHKEDCEDCESSTAKIDTFKRDIRFKGEIADKCPVHKTLHTDTQILTTLIPS